MTRRLEASGECPEGMWRCGVCGGCINDHHDCPGPPGKDEVRSEPIVMFGAGTLFMGEWQPGDSPPPTEEPPYDPPPPPPPPPPEGDAR